MNKSIRVLIKTIVSVLIMAATFVGLVPLSSYLADPLFTRPFDPRFQADILLIFPDHVEVRPVQDLAQFSPRPSNASYVFSIPPERERWAINKVETLSPPRPGSYWYLHIRQIGGGKQEVEFEARRDGFSGLLYEASHDQIVPLQTRVAGPGAAFTALGVNACLWCGAWVVWKIGSKLIRRAF